MVIFSLDLQLDVKGCRDVYASFDKYVEVEQLEGDNKYHAEQYGLQVKHHSSRSPSVKMVHSISSLVQPMELYIFVLLIVIPIF